MDSPVSVRPSPMVSVVGIDWDGEPRRVAAAEEDDVRAGINDGVGWEAEVTT